MIEPQTSVAEIMQRWPETIPIFLKYQTSCVGCLMASFESLESAAAVYDLPLEQFLRDLEAAIVLHE